ncbi:MAG TPA: hypothetical protein VMU69_11225 [Bradyrhizobium sp.]|nr:hypothetical protein [Bradyrhizobium sp.]
MVVGMPLIANVDGEQNRYWVAPSKKGVSETGPKSAPLEERGDNHKDSDKRNANPPAARRISIKIRLMPSPTITAVQANFESSLF